MNGKLEPKPSDKNKRQQSAYTAWMVSNCDKTTGARRRLKYAEELIKNGLHIDIFGLCAEVMKQKIPGYKNDFIQDDQLKKGDKPMAHSMMAISQYKFYLAFENGYHCKDYISEKLWRNSYQGDLVPVIFGPHPNDVIDVAPPHSYIHAEDFESPGELVDYLNYLNFNDTAYLEYHQWRLLDAEATKPRYNREMKIKCHTCQLVKKLKKEGYPRRYVPSLVKWYWWNSHDNKCIENWPLPYVLRD